MIENTIDPKTGAVLCPECGNGSVWKDPKDPAGKRMLTSPMQKMETPNKVNALVHKCCGQAVIRKAFAQVPAPGAVPARRDSIEIKAVVE